MTFTQLPQQRFRLLTSTELCSEIFLTLTDYFLPGFPHLLTCGPLCQGNIELELVDLPLLPLRIAFEVCFLTTWKLFA